ncbi:MAG: lipase family protein [Puniceicoccales bacterium]|nr:lipase family protein [Puniceicoccales bacterium]
MKKSVSILVMACVAAWGWGTAPSRIPLISGDESSYDTPSFQMGVETPLVFKDGRGFHVAPWFKAIQPDLLHLIKRSYVLTKRERNGKFRNEHRMLSDSSVSYIPETRHQWICDRNFTGIHGKLKESSRIGRVLNVAFEAVTLGRFAPEIDFPGYVAALQTGPYHVIAIVLRGSQGEDFQPGSGLLSASWATNYDAGPLEVDSGLYGFSGRMHGGYLTKINSCNLPQEEFEQMVSDHEINNPLQSRVDLDFIYPLFESVRRVIEQIPEDERDRIRFVVTGHSQGGGLAQVALPLMISQFGELITGFINNTETPRFFGYFLSAPRVAADQETVDSYNALVGHDNMINHFAFRDVVTMACLHGYKTLGHLACDSARDVLHRGICSEVAYNNRMLLLSFIQACIDASAFDTGDNQHWVLGENPELIICWDEIKHLLSYQQFTYERINPDGITDLCNFALDQYRQRYAIDGDLHFTVDQIPFTKYCNWEEIQRICCGDLFPNEIRLNEATCVILDRVVENIYGRTAIFSADGRFNVSALIDTVFDLLDAGRGSDNPGGCWECLKRCFCCCCSLFGRSNIQATFYFDPEFQALLESRGIDPTDLGIIRLGGGSLIAYLHFGSGANGFSSKLFDKFLPSRNLGFALRNGEIVTTQRNPVLRSEIKEISPIIDESHEEYSDGEVSAHRPPSVIFRMKKSKSAT